MNTRYSLASGQTFFRVSFQRVGRQDGLETRTFLRVRVSSTLFEKMLTRMLSLSYAGSLFLPCVEMYVYNIYIVAFPLALS